MTQPDPGPLNDALSAAQTAAVGYEQAVAELVDTLDGQVADRDATIAAQDVTLTDQAAQLEQDQADLAALRAQVADLQAQIAAMEPKTLFGFVPATQSATVVASTAAKLGTPGVLRIYDAGHGPAWAINSAKTVAGSVPVIVSWKLAPADVIAGKYDAELTAAFQAMPAGWWWSQNHEPDQKGRAYTAQQFIDSWRHAQALAVAAGCKAKSAVILTGYDLAARLPLFWPGDDHADGLGLDPYSSAAQTAPQMVQPLLDAAAKVTTRPVLICEVGCYYPGAARVTFVKSLADLRGKVAAVCWYDANLNGNFQISNDADASAAYKGLSA